MAHKPFWSPIETGAQLHVRLTPNAAHNRVDGAELRDNNTCVLRARVTAAPDKGKANKALIALLAKNLNLPKSKIAISAGQTSRQKTVTLSGDPAKIGEKLGALETKP